MSQEIRSGIAGFGRLSRRSLVLGVGGTLFASAMRRGGASAHGSEAIEGITYVARLENGISLAIVVGARDAFAFLTDGGGYAESFSGQSSRSMTLLSAGGGHLSASIDAEGFDGYVASGDGAAFGFNAPMASGIGGLYSVELGEGYISGSSMNGCRLLAGNVSLADDGFMLASGLVTSERYGSHAINANVSPNAWGRHLWIVHEDCLIAGGCLDSLGYGSAHTPSDLDA